MLCAPTRSAASRIASQASTVAPCSINLRNRMRWGGPFWPLSMKSRAPIRVSVKILERLKSLLSDAYSESFESFCTRVLYFFNTIDSYFLVAGLSSYLVVWPAPFRALRLAAALFVAWVTARIADFYPVFPVLAVPALGALIAAVPVQPWAVLSLIAANTGVLFA